MRFLFVCMLLCLSSAQAYAFYDYENDSVYTEARGLLFLATGNVDSQATHAMATRLMLDTDIMATWHVEYQQIWQQTYAATHNYNTEADRLNIAYSNETTQIKLGRQAISLTTTFFFSPNDFFAPFTVTSLNRDYKQGVDALNIEQQVGELSQLSLIAVNNHNESLPTSSVVKFDSVWGDASWAILAAEVYIPSLFSVSEMQHIVGGSMQFDIMDTLAFRGEGHISKTNGRTQSEWVTSLEYRANTDITLSSEYFYHGVKQPLPYLPYAGNRYLALGVSYQLTPLLFGQFSITRQLDDQSMLATVYLNYSLSNESTLNLSVVAPSGDAWSEFKQYPDTLAVDYQIYF